MSGVFLAHSSADKRFVRRLAADLLAHDVRVWFDEAELLVGDSLLAKIQQGVAEMDFLVVVLSPASVKSEWVQKEVELALLNEIGNATVTVLPIVRKHCEIPGFLRSKVWLDFSASRNYFANLERLLQRVAGAKTVDTTALLVAWTPKAVRLGMLCGLVMTKGGMVALADAFLDEVHATSRSWVAGETTFTDEGELMASAAAQTIVNLGQRETFPLSLEEAHYLFHHLALQVGNRAIDIAVRAQIMTVRDGDVSIAKDLVEEIIECVNYDADRITCSADVRPVVLPYVLDVVRARLLLCPTTQTDDCELVATMICPIFVKMLTTLMNFDDPDDIDEI